MNKERLIRVVEALRSRETFEFDITEWGMVRGCRTAGCAIHGYILASKGVDSGLELMWFGDKATLTGHGVANFDAVALEFDITKRQAIKLFSGSEYKDGIWTKRENVIVRILEEVKDEVLS